jgi:altronate dehydratase
MVFNVVLINPEDNVGVALEDIPQGLEARLSDGLVCKAVQDIPYSHKVALRDIEAGEPIRKYGEEIGYAREDIPAGSWVHTHNLEIREEQA